MPATRATASTSPLAILPLRMRRSVCGCMRTTPRATASRSVTGKTGVEMEALTAAAVAGLTLIDMLKAVEKGIELEVRLLAKSGGRSGEWRRPG